MNEKTVQTNDTTRKQIMELSALKHLQQYMDTFRPLYKKFEKKPQRHHPPTTFQFEIK